MAGIKFSGFTTGATTANTLIAGYDSVAGTNNQYSLAQLAAGIAPSLGIDTLYAENGTIGTTRKALITDTIQFRNAGDTSDILSLNTDGKFALGDGAICSTNTNVSIGKSANDGSSASYTGNVVIGNSVVAHNKNLVAIGASANSYNQAVAIGKDCIAQASGIGLGHYVGAGTFSVSIGESSGRPFPAGTADTINIGAYAQGTGANSMTFNVTRSAAAPATANACGIYMTSNTVPDFEVVGSGDSTLNTNLKVTGQSYSELVDAVNATLTVDWDDGNIQELTSLTGSLSFTASNPKIGATYILTLGQTGAVTPTWTGIKWPAATAPTLSGAGKTDIITLICYDATGAGLYYATSVLNYTT